MKTVLVIQARMGSTRLPAKILKEVLGKPLLELQIERLRRVAGINEIVIATTTNDGDQAVVDFCRKQGLECFRGSEDDVLSRYYHCAAQARADIVMRITSDCPLIDPDVVARVLNHYKSNAHRVDYVSNTIKRTFPRGLDVEVFSFKSLQESHKLATLPSDREHVTPFIYNAPERFRLDAILNGTDESRHRWTVDTPEDFELIRRIFEALYPTNPRFSLADVLTLLEQNPSWFEINSHIRQKELSAKTIVIRTDASIAIHTGHVMMCLNLASHLRAKGYDILFICRSLQGNMTAFIRQEGFHVEEILPSDDDAAETVRVIQKLPSKPHLLVVDHYGIDRSWESSLRPHTQKILVIDDLANRFHDCDLLIDANYPSKDTRRYLSLTPHGCALMIGSEYALLKSDYAQCRAALMQRHYDQIHRVLVFFGGVDATNETAKTLKAIQTINDRTFAIDVVIGSSNEHREEIASLVNRMHHTTLHVQTKNMPTLMAQADFSLGAGGTTTWERLCLGLPTIAICVADNQKESLEALSQEGLIEYLGPADKVSELKITTAIKGFLADPHRLRTLSERNASLVDGQGLSRVMHGIEKLLPHSH